MKNNYILKKLLLLTLLLVFSVSYSQTEKQKTKIIANYDLVKLQELHDEFSIKTKEEKEKAIKGAKTKGWPIIIKNKDGSFDELQHLRIDGTPVYYSTQNEDAAISTRANFMHTGGGLGLNVEGQGMTAHVWDGGATRITHQDFSGRVTINDGVTVGNANSFHAQHVTGTIVGLGLGNVSGRNSKGMAPQANALTHDWNNDLTEATAEAANGMLLSNHSYGSNIASVPDWAFGAYTSQSMDWDNLMYNAPYYLMVAAAGNDGNQNTENGAPLGGNSLYDKLSGNKTAKNNMVVTNGQDANIGANGILNSVTRNSGSSEGPTDDLRIKPDIMGNGTSLLSAYNNSDTAYNAISGTSMASPNVCGSLLLLQQHYNNVNGNFMKAATLKGLALHTADDTEATGPDANTGWGLMNTKVSAETITNNGLQSWISEETLSQGQTYTVTVKSDGTSPLLASISWTDPVTGGYTNSTGTANEATAALVNDLDIRVTKGGTTNHPWKLTGVSTNTNAIGTDNTVDPYERVDINGASGTYTITVTHKGTLTNSEQKFSLVVTGLDSSIALIKKTEDLVICSNNDAVINFDYKGSLLSGTSIISSNNVPAGVIVNFSQNNLTTNTNFDVTLSNLSIVPAGDYTIQIIANNGTETEVRNIYLTIYHNTFTSNVTQTIPSNGSIGLGTSNLLKWDAHTNAEEYVLEVATDANFNTIVNTYTLTTNQYTLNGLTPGEVYYWRVFGKNRCVTASTSNPFSFQIGALSCNTDTQTTDQAITDQATETSILNITNTVTIGDINVRVAYNHTWIGDVGLTLISPTGTRVMLINVLTCTDQTDFNINFDDDATNVINCATANGGGVTTYKPVGQLLDFIGESSFGAWTLEITDGGPGDTGTVTEWAIEICEVSTFASAPNFVNNGLNPDLNSTYTTVIGDIEATTALETATQQAYTLIELPTKGTLLKNAVALAIGDTFTQDDVNTSKITYTNTETTAFADQFKVDINNAVNGWLPNQIVPINGTLGVVEFDLNDLFIFPNPTNRNINIRIQSATNTDVKINIFDIQGRKVYNTFKESNSGLFNTTLDLGKLANGIYLIDVQQGNRKTTKRIIINN
ncbi:MAG: S8 family serine peptidase [Flavobacteriaceae bacterium]|nr:S8 family serine peptidase [Flavobacteriaceae bacterium]